MPDGFDGPPLIHVSDTTEPVDELAIPFGNFNKALEYVIDTPQLTGNMFQVQVNCEVMINPEVSVVVSAPYWHANYLPHTGLSYNDPESYITYTEEYLHDNVYKGMTPQLSFGVYTAVACSLYNPQVSANDVKRRITELLKENYDIKNLLN